MKNKKIYTYLFWIISSLVLFIGIGGIVAYAAMTMKEEKPNKFQIGKLETKVEEKFTAPNSIKSGSLITKEVAVKNSGTIDQFVRVMLQPEIKVKFEDEWLLLPSEIGKEIIIDDLDIKNWKLAEDGYYYYLNKVAVTESSTKLFTKIKLSDTLDASYNQAAFTLLVKVEAVNTFETNYRQAWWQESLESTSTNLKVIDDTLYKIADKNK